MKPGWHAGHCAPDNRRAVETIVLVHGLWMHGFVFILQGYWLRRHGFAVRSFSYPTVRSGLAQNVAALARFIGAIDAATIHLVGHSLGGLVIMKLLAQPADPRLGRVVLMGSPCRGSRCAGVLLGRRRLAAVVGATLCDWLASPALRPQGTTDIGVLAGTRSLGFGRAIANLPRPNDGVVAVDETRLDAAKDTIALPVAHSEMLVSKACADQVAAFLKTGKFSHA